MKYEWRKHGRAEYLPKARPEIKTIPEYPFLIIAGKGNPNDEDFAERIGVLYSLSYGMKKVLKEAGALIDYDDYTVFPLEGVWTISGELEDEFSKDRLMYEIMIRQPDTVTPAYLEEVLRRVEKKKANPLLAEVWLERKTDGQAVQMLHIGSYDDEWKSFQEMDEFCRSQGLVRNSACHREIYLTDGRKTAPEKQKTILRYFVEPMEPVSR